MASLFVACLAWTKGPKFSKPTTSPSPLLAPFLRQAAPWLAAQKSEATQITVSPGVRWLLAPNMAQSEIAAARAKVLSPISLTSSAEVQAAVSWADEAIMEVERLAAKRGDEPLSPRLAVERLIAVEATRLIDTLSLSKPAHAVAIYEEWQRTRAPLIQWAAAQAVEGSRPVPGLGPAVRRTHATQQAEHSRLPICLMPDP